MTMVVGHKEHTFYLSKENTFYLSKENTFCLERTQEARGWWQVGIENTFYLSIDNTFSTYEDGGKVRTRTVVYIQV